MEYFFYYKKPRGSNKRCLNKILDNKGEIMKKILSIIFIISFIPYIILISYGIYSAIFGYDVYTWILPTYVETIYGLDAFLEAVTVLGLSLIFIPVIPICIIYDALYLGLKLIFYFRKKSKSIKTEQT